MQELQDRFNQLQSARINELSERNKEANALKAEVKTLENTVRERDLELRKLTHELTAVKSELRSKLEDMAQSTQLRVHEMVT